MLEEKIEDYLRDEVEKRGGECWKLTTPGRRGVPDRLVMVYGQTVFVELKKPGGKPEPHQVRAHARMRECGGARVCVIDSKFSVGCLLLDLHAKMRRGQK